MKQLKVAGLCLTLFAALTGCGIAGLSSTVAPLPTQVIQANTPIEAPATQADAAAGPCPQPSEGMQPVTDDARGFCVLVPAGFSANILADETSFIGPKPESGSPALAILQVQPTDAVTAADAAAPIISEAEGMGITLQQQRVSLGSEEALVIDGLPGQDVNRQVFAVHNGMLYHIWFTPYDPRTPDHAAIQSLYDAMLGSFTFLP